MSSFHGQILQILIFLCCCLTTLGLYFTVKVELLHRKEPPVKAGGISGRKSWYSLSTLSKVLNKSIEYYYYSFSRPNVCLARLQMELCSPLKSKVSIFGASLKFLVCNWKYCIWRLTVCQNFSLQVCFCRTTSVRNIQISDCVHTIKTIVNVSYIASY